MRRPLTVLALLSVLALSGCAAQSGSTSSDSTKDFTGPQKAVAATVENLQQAAKDRKGTTICADLITAKLRDAISATDCPDLVHHTIRETDDIDLSVKTVTITGDKATAQVKEKTGESASRTRTIEFENTAGRWRISALPPAAQ